MNISPYLVSTDPALVNLQNGSFSLSFWVQSSNASAPYTATTLFEGPAWYVVMQTDGSIVFAVLDTAGHTVSTVTAPSILGNPVWNFVAVVYDALGDSISIFMNGIGQRATAGTVDASIPEIPDFRVGSASFFGTGPVSFQIDEVAVWGRPLTSSEVTLLYGNGTALPYPFLGGEVTLIFQGLLINDPATPLVCGFNGNLWNVNRSTNFTTSGKFFDASMEPIFAGRTVSQGYLWAATNFSDKILFAEHDNQAQYWVPPAASTLPLPGLPTSESTWDGVTAFTNHVVLWKDDVLKWSDVNDFSAWIPVAQTAVSAVLNTTVPIVQPGLDTTISIPVANLAAPIIALSISGNMTFGNVAVGVTASAVLEITNTGPAAVTVTGINLPSQFAGNFSGVIPAGEAVPVTIAFTPTTAGSYGGSLWVSSNATIVSNSLAISGTGTTTVPGIELSGVLVFGPIRISHTVASDLIITNTGTANLVVAAITLPTGFSGTFAGTIAPNTSASVPITFAPVDPNANYNGDIVVTSNSAFGVGSIAVSGEGIRFQPFSLFITDNGTCQFGSVVTGSSPTGTIRIYNPGDYDVYVYGLTMPNGFSGGFTGTIGPTSHQDVTVTFSPSVVQPYGGIITATAQGQQSGYPPNTPVTGSLTVSVSGTGIQSGSFIVLTGILDFGQVAVGSFSQTTLNIANTGSAALTVTGITLPTYFSGTFAGTIAPGANVNVLILYKPIAAGTVTDVITVASDAAGGSNSIPVDAVAVAAPVPALLVPNQYLSLVDDFSSVHETYYNYFKVISMNGVTLQATLVDTTGRSPQGTVFPSGTEIDTVDANESGETRVVGHDMNGPIWGVVPQGDYAWIFKERSIQSIQYVGLGSGTFFIHPEVSGEGLLSRYAFANLADGRTILLGHKELYAYQGGPTITPVCQQFTRQLYTELDRSRLEQIRVHNNEIRNELWILFPSSGGSGFRILVWNYLEDSASIDDYPQDIRFTAFGTVDWSADPIWSQIPNNSSTWWENYDATITWESLVASGLDHITLMGSLDGSLRIWGASYTREGEGYLALSETMDFDFGDADVYKYVDVVVLYIQVLNPDPTTANTMFVQVGTSAGFDGDPKSITWTDPKWPASGNTSDVVAGRVLVNGTAKFPIKINPGGSGRFMRLRFSSADPGVQWRVAAFEIHTRPGGTY